MAFSFTLALCALLNTGCAVLRPTAEQMDVAQGRCWSQQVALAHPGSSAGSSASPDHGAAQLIASLLQWLAK